MAQSKSRSQGVSRREVQQMLNAIVKPALASIRDLERRLKALERQAGKPATKTVRRPIRRATRKPTKVMRRSAQSSAPGLSVSSPPSEGPAPQEISGENTASMPRPGG
jgi:hypothetical protein